jgi:hypothetical protein
MSMSLERIQTLQLFVGPKTALISDMALCLDISTDESKEIKNSFNSLRAKGFFRES